jgi:Cu+-exporting ATPase
MPRPTQNSPTTVILPVEGMTCASCVQRVEKALLRVDGVSESNVNLASEKVMLTFDATKTDLPKLAVAVEKAGYKLILTEQSNISTNETVSSEVSAEDESRKDQLFNKLKKEFIFSISLAVPIMILSMVSMSDWFMRWSPLSMSEINTMLFIATTLVVFVSGKRFFITAWQLAKHFTADMNTLIAVGTGTAYLYSSSVVLFPQWFSVRTGTHDVYFDTAAMIIALILMGRVFEAKAKHRTSDAIHKLIQLQPKTARAIRSGIEMDIPLNDIRLNDMVVVRPGEKVPVDGSITQGETTIDASMMTGESLPIRKQVGDTVIGGTINHDGSILFKATGVGKDTVLAHIIRSVEEAQASKAPIQALADRIAAIFVPTVIVIAILTFAGWYFIGGLPFSTSMINFIAVLIIACPCALGLATPTAIIVSTGVGASSGVLIRNAESLERLHQIKTIVFDKTGTITEGKPSVTQIIPFNGFDERTLIQNAASIEKRSEHPYAKAIVEYAKQQKAELHEPQSFQSLPGLGVMAIVEGHAIVIGNQAFMNEHGITLTIAETSIKELAAVAKTPICVAINGKLAGLIAVTDAIKPTSRRAIEELHRMKIEVVMITGDNEETARTIAQQAGIDRVIANVLPQDKAFHVRALEAEGKSVAMVGDGINDAPALATASIGIAMGTGTDIAMEAADITVMSGNLSDVVHAMQLSKRTVRTIKQNLFWAFIYNIVGIPLAAFGLLNPVFAAGAMALSSVSVISNSLRLKFLTGKSRNEEFKQNGTPS